MTGSRQQAADIKIARHDIQNLNALCFNATFPLKENIVLRLEPSFMIMMRPEHLPTLGRINIRVLLKIK